MTSDRTEMLYWLQQERREKALDLAKRTIELKISEIPPIPVHHVLWPPGEQVDTLCTPVRQFGDSQRSNNYGTSILFYLLYIKWWIWYISAQFALWILMFNYLIEKFSRMSWSCFCGWKKTIQISPLFSDTNFSSFLTNVLKTVTC